SLCPHHNPRGFLPCIFSPRHAEEGMREQLGGHLAPSLRQATMAIHRDEEAAPWAWKPRALPVAPATSLTGLLCSSQCCCVCRKKGATVACRQKRCLRRFHLRCGSQRGCISQFFGDPWPHSTLLSSPTSFCWEHRPQQTLETLQEGHTMCIICMEMVEDSPSYTTMVCPSCKHAWFHRGCIHVGGPSLCQPAGTPCARSDVLLTRGASSVSTLQAESPVWHECPRAQQGRAEPQPWQLLLCSLCATSGTHCRCSHLGDTSQQWECAGCAGPGTGKGHGVLRLRVAEPFMPTQGRTAKLGPLWARQGGE
uniref:PHF7/G2E3-like PHD zinc finger domain-containing protein n=1 Tax=Anser cygnoides TaxID=8845 RepID=A0A8B9IHB9_ANSCY